MKNRDRTIVFYPKEVREAAVFQAAKDYGISKKRVRELLKKALKERRTTCLTKKG